MKSNQESTKSGQIEQEFLTRPESARFLRISLASFDKIKNLERIKYGKSVRFSIRSLRDYAAKHTVGGIQNDK